MIHQIDGKRALSYDFRIRSINDVASHQITNYTTAINYRQKLHKNWLFMTLRPQIDYAASNKFIKDPSMTILFEAVFGSL